MYVCMYVHRMKDLHYGDVPLLWRLIILFLKFLKLLVV